MPQRLAKWVHDASGLSVAAVKDAEKAGRLSLRSEGESQKRTAEWGDWVYEGDSVWLDGTALIARRTARTFLLNKPRAILCVRHDPRGKGDLAPWLEQMPSGVFAVGRLDRDTTGALLCTTDGDLANGLLRPERHADKLYSLEISEKLNQCDDRLRRLRKGVDVGPYFARAKRVEWDHSRERFTRLTVTLDEGRHRQIRRMCRTVGLPLRALHRESVGPLSVEGMEVGQFRELDPGEVEQLWMAIGGRERLEQEKFQALVKRAASLRQQGKPDPRLESWLAANSLARSEK